MCSALAELHWRIICLLFLVKPTVVRSLQASSPHGFFFPVFRWVSEVKRTDGAQRSRYELLFQLVPIGETKKEDRLGLHAFPTRAHRLQRWFGVRHFLILRASGWTGVGQGWLVALAWE